MAHRRAIKETIAITRDWVYNQTCRLSDDIHVLITLDYYLFEVTKKPLFSLPEFSPILVMPI